MSPLPRRWDQGYVAAFHAEHEGITERVLSRCRAEGTDPYRWCAAALGRRAERTLDLACGSGPLAAHLPGWVGVDLSTDELSVAAAGGRQPLLQADAAHLPLAARSVDAVACSMALQVVEPLEATFAEMARVLRPSGRVAVLLPASGPLGVADARLYVRLQAALRQRVEYPNTRWLRAKSLAQLATAVGLTVTADERRAFTLPLRSNADIDELVASLYLPGVSPERLARGREVLQTRVRKSITVPLRRVVLNRAFGR